VSPRTFISLAAIVVALLALAACAPAPGPTPTPTATATPSAPTPTPVPLPTDTTIPRPPQADTLALVARYLGKSPSPLSVGTLYSNETVGTRTSFWVLEVDGPKMREVTATLQHVSDTALWYVADPIDITDRDLQTAANAFDTRVLPEVLRLISPDLELPGKITILNASTPGLAGYFSSYDTLPSAAFKFSNQRVMMVMNGSDVRSERYLGTLAHELQHLTQWHIDPTEESWVSEGLAEFVAGSLELPKLPLDSYFDNPGVSFSTWPEDPGQSIPAYAAGSLFFTYLHDQLGLDAIQQIVSEPLDSVDGIAAIFEDRPRDFPTFFGDWLAANVARATNGTYAYDTPPGSVRVPDLLATPGTFEGEAPQLGAAFVRLDPGNLPFTVRFDGASLTPLLPVAPHGGDRCWWGNRGDGIDSTLTRRFDLTGLDRATLRFWTWYAIEDGFDHAYVAASTDDGASWQALPSNGTTDNDPIGTSLGPSYTGNSGQWVEETIDLASYAGSQVQLRFNYVTDESINSTGWCIDNIAIPELAFADGAEVDAGWEANGFVRVQRDGIPQRFVLRTVAGTGASAIVTAIDLNDANDATFVVDAPVTLVIGGLTDQTTQHGAFTITAAR
jgi:immune inhibitor A